MSFLSQAWLFIALAAIVFALAFAIPYSLYLQRRKRHYTFDLWITNGEVDSVRDPSEDGKYIGDPLLCSRIIELYKKLGLRHRQLVRVEYYPDANRLEIIQPH